MKTLFPHTPPSGSRCGNASRLDLLHVGLPFGIEEEEEDDDEEEDLLT